MRRRISLVLIMMLVLTSIIGCSSGSITSSKSSMDYASVQSNSWGFADGSAGNPPMDMVEELGSPDYYYDDVVQEESKAKNESEQKLIKRGNMNLRVKGIPEAFDSVKELLSNKDGFIIDLQERNNNYNMYLNLKIKVKAPEFETLFEELKELGKVEESNISTQDITTQYIDLTARLKTLEVQEETLQNIMSKANKVEDLLRVEQELQRVRQQIESSQGQLNYFDNAISYSVIELQMSAEEVPTTPIKEDENIFEKFIFSIKDGFGFWGSVLLNFIAAILWLLPVIVVLVILFILGKKVFIKRKNKKTDSKKPKFEDKDK